MNFNIVTDSTLQQLAERCTVIMSKFQTDAIPTGKNEGPANNQALFVRVGDKRSDKALCELIELLWTTYLMETNSRSRRLEIFFPFYRIGNDFALGATDTGALAERMPPAITSWIQGRLTKHALASDPNDHVFNLLRVYYSVIDMEADNWSAVSDATSRTPIFHVVVGNNNEQRTGEADAECAGFNSLPAQLDWSYGWWSRSQPLKC